ncbi:hypothetical protein HTZ84_22240 [Haloterrigena sp. SYSU A558-1]|uniref:Uncharacterized protein n=1 Tax=Haloterrigena gelatinilytica TaxID=2741724 RepID=A0ABX2LMV0_9EURY|nr:hypothetical protein [Haloterrigena gelatinilytica]NUC74987.1 hypothetical protein [Haloterrigena gelatinilytica]
MPDAEPAFQVDIPIVVTPEMAEDIRDDLEETGRVSVELRTSRAPKAVEMIEWQLEHEQPLLEFTEDYDSNE